MKVAILGPSTSALQMTHKLLELGASVRLFWGTEVETPEQIKLAQDGVIVPHPWKAVTKRFLLPGQVPTGKTRFTDLFRVTYLVDPTPMIEKGKTTQPEMYEKMTEEFLSSLKGDLEMFEDVDVVIDASPSVPRGSIGPGGVAVGESKLREGTHLIMPTATNLATFVGQAQEIALVGAGTLAGEALVRLRSWLEASASHRIFLITAETNPFADATGELKAMLKAQTDAQVKAVEVHGRQEAEWLELDDFIKAKKPRPEIPIPQLVFFSGHIVSATDQLVDKSRTFLTCEAIPWSQGLVQPENNALELKTIGVDKLIIATGTRRPWERFQGLDLIASSDAKDAREANGVHPEIAFFTLKGDGDSGRQMAIMQNLQKLFSRTGA